jgi:hypothetical protein
MNSQKLNNSEVCAEQAANKKHQFIKLGLDVHADRIVVVRIPITARRNRPGASVGPSSASGSKPRSR